MNMEENVVKAVYIGDQGLLKLLIREGANINKADDDGVTAVHIAAGQGAPSLCRR